MACISTFCHQYLTEWTLDNPPDGYRTKIDPPPPHPFMGHVIVEAPRGKIFNHSNKIVFLKCTINVFYIRNTRTIPIKFN